MISAIFQILGKYRSNILSNNLINLHDNFERKPFKHDCRNAIDIWSFIIIFRSRLIICPINLGEIKEVSSRLSGYTTYIYQVVQNINIIICHIFKK